MKKTRYLFFKSIYKNKMLIIDNKIIDKNFSMFLKAKSYRKLDKLKIDYVVIENTKVIKVKRNEVNNYNLYYKKYHLNTIINKIKNSLYK